MKPRTEKPAASSPPIGGDGREFTAWVSLPLLALAAFLPALFGGYIWDDDFYVTGNQTLRSLDGLRRIWLEIGAVPQYYPMVHTSYWIEFRFWGLHAGGYHAVNIALHGLNAMLAWRILRRLDLPGAWLAAAIFAVHPVHVESVAWVTERKNVLSGFFYLASANAFLRFSGIGEAASARPRTGPWNSFALSYALFVCALLSKTVTATLPCALALLLWWKRGGVTRREAAALGVMLATGAPMGALTAWIERNFVGAVGREWDWTVADRLMIAGRAAWFYLGKLLAPLDLSFIYPRWTLPGGWSAAHGHGVAALAALAAAALLRRRFGKGPLVAALFFGGTLFPALGLTNVFPMKYSFVADHFQYLASLGIFALGAAAIALAARQSGEQGRQLAIYAAGAILLALAALSARQCLAYKSEKSLWLDTLTKNPAADIAHAHLARILVEQGDSERHLAQLDRALAGQPNSASLLALKGSTLYALGRPEEARPFLEAAVRLDPASVVANHKLGLDCLDRLLYREALICFIRVLRQAPFHSEAPVGMAWAYHRLERPSRALEAALRAVALNPSNTQAWACVARIRWKAGDLNGAVEAYARALELNPEQGNVQKDFGIVLAIQGRIGEAQRRFAEAVRIDPNDAEAREYEAKARAQLAGPGGGAPP